MSTDEWISWQIGSTSGADKLERLQIDDDDDGWSEVLMFDNTSSTWS